MSTCATDRTPAARIAAAWRPIRTPTKRAARALNGALTAARPHGLQAQLLDLRHSGDTAGDRRRVVGCATLALSAPVEGTTSKDDELKLGAAPISRARNIIAQALGLVSALRNSPSAGCSGSAGAARQR